MPASFRRIPFATLCQGDPAAVGALVAVLCGANWRLLAGRVTEHWDGEQFFAPFFSLLARTARSGHCLLWNPFSAGGSPDFAEPQVGAFSPVTLLFGLIAGPSPFAFRLYWLGLWLLGGLGMYVLARALSAPPWGALIAGLGLGFSGFYVGHAEHTSVIYSFAFFPWIVWRVRAAMRTRGVWPALEAGALWGLCALGGNPAVVIPGALFVGVVALAWLPDARPGLPAWGRWRVYARTMGLLAVVGIVVLAPTYLSFRHEVAGFSDRSLPLPREVVLPPQSLGFKWLLNVASPMILIGTYQSPGWPSLDICYLPLYFGAALPVLAVFALWRRRAGWEPWAVAGAGLLFLGFTLGSALPLRGWLYDLLPPTRFIRHPPMFRGFFLLAVAMLAAAGTGILEEHRRTAKPGNPPWHALAVVAGTLATGSVAAFAWVLSTPPTVQGESLLPVASLHLAVAWVGLTLLCLAAARRAGVRPYFPAGLALLAAVDLTGAFAFMDNVLYNTSPPPDAPAPTLPLLELGPAGFARVASAHGNRNLYALRPAFISYTAMVNPVRTEWEKDGLLVSKVIGPQRLWFADAAPVVPPSPAAFAAFQRRSHEVNGLIVLRHTRADLLADPADVPPDRHLAAIATAPPAESVVARVDRYRADDLALSVACPRAGFLLVTDRWSRSWTATVNGEPVPVDGGDFLFRLIPVAAGENRIEMKFQPPGVFPLVALSWGTLAVVGVGSLRRIPRRRKFLPPPVSGIRPALIEAVACVPS